MKILSKCSSELSVREGQDARQEHKTLWPPHNWGRADSQIIHYNRLQGPELPDKVLLGVRSHILTGGLASPSTPPIVFTGPGLIYSLLS